MHKGGSLFSDAIFKKILSIGYEFETSDLAKLSMHENKRTLVNSDLTLRLLKTKIDNKSIKIVDNNYLHVRIPIPKKGEPLVSDEPEITAEEDAEMKEFLLAMKEEFPEQYEQEQEEALAKKENDSYLEYFNENRKGDNRETTKFQITNDLGETPFGNMVKKLCEELTIPKNEQFFFKTSKGKLYNFKFSEDIAKNKKCEMFSGVEYVITYYNPKRDNPNIIIDTFVDACSRIIDHMGDLKPVNGTLFIQDDKKTHYSPVGVIENERRLYRKPNTNLFYMDTYDDENTLKLKNIDKVEFIPQMTFRCKAIDAIDIMKEMLAGDKTFTQADVILDAMEDDLSDIFTIETMVNNLFLKYNETREDKIPLNGDAYKTLKTYLFLIYFKLYMLIKNHVKILSGEDYLKDYLSFASRHPNYDLYQHAKLLLKEHFNIVDVDDIQNLLVNPDIVRIIYEEDEKEPHEDDYDENGNYKYNLTAFKDDLPISDKNYGDPFFSLKSYFEFFEKKNDDWLDVSKLDAFSTTFDLTSDEILLENRSFRFALEIYLRNVTKLNVTKDALSVNDMHKIVNTLYNKKSIKRMMTLSRHPSKKILTRKVKSVSKSVLKPLTPPNPPMMSAIKEVSKEEDTSPFEPIPDNDLGPMPIPPVQTTAISRYSRRVKPPSRRNSKSKKGSMQ